MIVETLISAQVCSDKLSWKVSWSAKSEKRYWVTNTRDGSQDIRDRRARE